MVKFIKMKDRQSPSPPPPQKKNYDYATLA